MNNLHDEINTKTISVFKLEDCGSDQWHTLQSNSNDYYVIILLRKFDGIFFANEITKVHSGTVLLFLSPKTSYSIESLKNDQTGFLCLFSKSFFTESINNKLNALPMFAEINEQQDLHICGIYTRMLCEMDSHYTFKYDSLRNYISELTHFALKSLSGK